MLFFQTLLFVGYLYAHVSQRWLRPKGQVTVHLILVMLALAIMPISPNVGWKSASQAAPLARVLGLLLVTVGLPYFVLSATSPLVQTWFGRNCPGRSPYRLYALSNFGSLVGLLTYPFVIEPALNLSTQSQLWSWGFGAYAILSCACLISIWRAKLTGSSVPAAAPNSTSIAIPGHRNSAAPAWWLRLLWLCLPAWASLMLLATTNHVCQDVAVIPLLWVVPLTLYLITLVICFDHTKWYRRGPWAIAATVGIVVAAGNDTFNWFGYELGLGQQLSMYFIAMFCICMLCHGELVRLRPDSRFLTEFYLLMSAGGALGGVVVTLIAPRVFTNYIEWQISLLGSFALAVGALMLSAPCRVSRATRNALLTPLVLVVLIYIYRWQRPKYQPLERVRNFYGVISVVEFDRGNAAKHELMMKHGRTTHGRQFADAAKRHLTTSFYSEESGVGKTIRYLGNRGSLRVGAIGMGIGTVAAYARPGDVYRFYEINPEVPRLARKYFTYMRDCQGVCEVVLGDARQSMSNEPPERYQLLILDAFSGDSPPVHLLTREAFDVYRRHLELDGVIAVNITAHYLRFAPVLHAEANDSGLKIVRVFSEGSEDRLTYPTDWIMLTTHKGFLQAMPSVSPPSAHDDFTVPLWTDHYSNLFQILTKI